METCDICENTCKSTTHGGDGWARCCSCIWNFIEDTSYCSTCRDREQGEYVQEIISDSVARIGY